ncbi:MAG: EVE domain-containing protein [Spirochaetia bacterium]|nr:EVE domain-containing protein [Spirochaetia bacterium]
MKYWLMKTEPGTFSWEDLQKCKKKTTHWEGVRNYQARNFMMHEMKIGDGILFYHSVVKPTAIMGIARVSKNAYPDFFAFDPDSNYYDPKSSFDNPRWFMVDITFERSFRSPLTLDEIKTIPELKEMNLLKKGNRLSIQPVSQKEWNKIQKLRP